MIKMRCRFGWHDWSSWGNPLEKVRLHVHEKYSFFPTHIEYTELVQTAQCYDCGAVRQRHIASVGQRHLPHGHPAAVR